MTADASQPHLHAGDDALLDLALGLVPPAEAEALRLELSRCVHCEQRFRACVGDLERSRARAAAALAPHALRRAPRPRPVLWLVAASVLVLLGGVWWAQPAGLRRLPLLPEPLPGRAGEPGAFAPHRDAGAAEDALQAALRDYDAGEFATARARLAQVDSLPPALDRLRRVYLADCLARANDWAGVTSTLDGLRLLDLPEPWQSRTRWTLAVANARLGRIAQARTALLELERLGGPYAGRADSILRTQLR